mmetsp:Transcript_27451/g.74578  ORF Transcript_27451/g.74578 Transcript_27451/m.74578 type:complete len:362 (-) Transcript_27451:17-1102(-)
MQPRLRLRRLGPADKEGRLLCSDAALLHVGLGRGLLFVAHGLLHGVESVTRQRDDDAAVELERGLRIEQEDGHHDRQGLNENVRRGEGERRVVLEHEVLHVGADTAHHGNDHNEQPGGRLIVFVPLVESADLAVEEGPREKDWNHSKLEPEEERNHTHLGANLLDHAVSGDHLDRRSNSGDAHEHRAEEVVVSRARAKANEDRAKDERGEAQVGHLRVGLLQNKALVRHDNGRDGGLDGHLEGNTDQVERPVCEAHVEGREEGDLGEPAEVVHREHSELGLASHEDKGASDHGREAREEREGDRVVERVAAEAHLGKESLSDHRASVHEHRSAREERLAHHVDGCHGLGHGAGQRVGTGER